MGKAVQAFGTAVLVAGGIILTGGTAALALIGGTAAAAVVAATPTVPASVREPSEFSYKVDAGLPIPFGRVACAGDVNYRVAYDETNRYQSLFCTLAASGPIKSIVSFAADDELTSFDGTTQKATNGDHEGFMWLQTKLGTQPQTALTSPTGTGAPSIPAPDWTADHKQSGRAVYCLTMFENSKFTEFPSGIVQPRFVIEGVYGWDPRQDSTWPGGSGSCDIEDPSTWVWIDNPAIAALNWVIGRWEGLSTGYSPARYGVPYASKIVAGLGASLDGIDVAAFMNAANVADANGWTVAAYPTSRDDKFEVLSKLLAACGSEPARKAGRISCVCHAEEVASSVTVTGADTAGPVEIEFGQSRLERKNTVIPRVWSEDHNWEMTPIDPVSDTDWVTEDGGRRGRGLDLHYVPEADQAAQLGYYSLANDREAIRGVAPFKAHMRRIGPGDCFIWSAPGLPLDGVKVKCLKRSYDPMTGVVRITFRSETDAKHTAAAALTGATSPAADPTTPPSVEVDPPTDLEVAVDGDEATLTWTNGSANYFRTVILQSPTSSLSDAYEVAGRNAAGLSAQTAIFKPGAGAWWWWIKGVDGPGLEQSAEVGPVTATVGGPAVATITGLGDLAVKDTISTADVDDDAVVSIEAFDGFSEPVTTSGATSDLTAVTVMEFEVTTAGEPLLIRPSMMCRFWHPASGDFDFTLRFIRVGGGTVRPDKNIPAINGDQFHGQLAPEFIDQPAAGTHTYQVKAWASRNDGFDFREFTDLTATVIHLKTSTI